MGKVIATKSSPESRDISPWPGHDRFAPVYTLMLSGDKENSLNLKPFVKSISYDEADDGLSELKVTITNPQKKFDHHPLFRAKSTIEVMIGYPGQMTTGNRFYIDEPKFSYSSDPTISLSSKDQSILVGEGKKTRTWEKLTDSEIAAKIANEQGMACDITPTTEKVDRVTQADESDIKFLQKRAINHGYQVYVDHLNGKPTLHFHEPKGEAPSITLAFQLGPKSSSLQEFIVENQTFQGAPKVQEKGVDPATGKEFKATGEPKKDAVRKTAVLDRKSEDLVLQQSTTKPAPTPVTHQVVDDHGPTDPKMSAKKATKMEESGRFTIEATGKIIGIPLRPRMVVNVVGVGKHSGPYYVKSVSHKLDSGYSCSFKCRTSQEGKEKGAPKYANKSDHNPKRGDSADVTPKPKYVAKLTADGRDLALVEKK
jgi:phage protein D